MIEIQNLLFFYDSNPLYQDFNASFCAGHVYGLLGKNGSGKTSLLGLISGTLFAKKGGITTLGYNANERKPAMLANIFYLPEPFSLPKMSTKTYLSLYSGFYPKFNLKEFNYYCEMFEITNVKTLSRMSMGQQKKFLIAFGLATNCQLNLLDEPTNGLDIPSKTIFRRAISASATEEKTFIISTHQVKDIENLVDHICIVDHGKQILNQSTETLSQQLSFTHQTSLDGNEFYTEPAGLGQYQVINQNQSGVASQLKETLNN